MQLRANTPSIEGQMDVEQEYRLSENSELHLQCDHDQVVDPEQKVEKNVICEYTLLSPVARGVEQPEKTMTVCICAFTLPCN